MQANVRAFTPEGCLDGTADGLARGWIWDTSNPQRRVAVEVVLDGAYLGTAVADLRRKDLVDAGKGDGACAFEIPLPASSCDGARHTLEAFVAGTATPLAGSPMVAVLDTKPIPPAKTGRTADPSQQRKAALTHRSLQQRAIKVADLDFTRAVAGESAASFSGMAVVIPTHNRAAALDAALIAWSQVNRPCEVEFIVVDDGSTDDTPATLERLSGEIAGLRWIRTGNGGPALARNQGVAMTQQPLVLFTGDDIRPSSADILVHHYRAHCCFPGREAAVLGKITWPDSPDERANFVMNHIQGIGQQQFGFFHLLPYSWLGWDFFYTSNVSLKRDVVADWNEEGFSGRFPLAGFEDAEFAYRLSRRPGGFRILYCPSATATHHHRYSVRQFLERQTGAGLMAAVFEEMHPEAARDLGTERVTAALAEPAGSHGPLVDEYLSLMEGIKSSAVILEQDHDLGSQNWHADLLHAVFQVAFLQGRVLGHKDPGANHAAAYRAILSLFQEQLSTAASYEALGRMLDLALVP